MLHWLVLSWALTGGLVPLHDSGIIENGGGAFLSYPGESFFTEVDFKARIWKHIELSAEIKTYEDFDTETKLSFIPYQADYTAGAAIVFDNFELGVRHECDHGIEAGSIVQYWMAGDETQIYVTIKGSSSF